MVSNYGYTEEYKRFYFRDIQGIVLQQTSAWLIWTAVLGMIVVVGAACWLSKELALKIIGTIFGAPALLFFRINRAFGPTCRLYLQTAVQRELILPVCRIGASKRWLAKVQPLIEQAQGSLSRDELQSRTGRSVP